MKVMLTAWLLSISALFSCSQIENPNKSMSNSLTATTNSSEPGSLSLNTDTATFANGCFWCTEVIFQQLEGVLKVSSGYSGGHVVNPTYKEVCTGTTGHAECIQVIYDPSKITFDELLEVFWQTHDPTTLNKQGNDEGPQYRSAVFFHTQEQKAKAQKYKEELDKSGAFRAPIITEVSPFTSFYIAENYHQDYYNANGSQPYCTYVIRPKLEKFQKVFKSKLKH